jgi:predicted lactoylglutathione lyase
VEQRLSLITLGVADVSRAGAFYEALGWHIDGGVDDETDQVAFFQAGGIIVALWDRAKLAEDSGIDDPGGWGGVTLAYNVRSPDEVDAVLREAQDAGATVPRFGAPTFWGGYSGVFIDLDGHPWEVAHNPAWTVHEDGRTTLE